MVCLEWRMTEEVESFNTLHKWSTADNSTWNKSRLLIRMDINAGIIWCQSFLHKPHSAVNTGIWNGHSWGHAYDNYGNIEENSKCSEGDGDWCVDGTSGQHMLAEHTSKEEGSLEHQWKTLNERVTSEVYPIALKVTTTLDHWPTHATVPLTATNVASREIGMFAYIRQVVVIILLG